MARHKESERDQLLSESRQSLLRAAAKEFAGEGFNGANINRISKAAGFAKGTIYNYFPSKRALMLALIDDTAADHVNFIVERVRDEEDASRRLARFFEAGFAFVTEHLDRAQTMVQMLYGPDSAFKMHMYQAYQPLFQFLAREIVSTGIEQGKFREVDPGATANLLMTIYLGTGSQVSDEGSPWLDAQEVADFVLNGMRQGR